MARLPSLAAARAQPLRPALRRPLLRVPVRRAALIALASVAAVGLAYVIARETPLFAVKDLEIVGASPDVRQDVGGVIDELAGTSLVKIDPAAVERDLRALPSVLDVSVDRSFPHALRVAVVPERPLAVVRDGQAAWIVSRRGHVIRAVERGSRPVLPRIRSTAAAGLSPGEQVADAGARVLLRVLADVPADFPARIRAARGDEGGFTLMLGAETELRLGSADDLGLKLAAASAVLRTMSEDERQELAYLDVRLPQRVVVLDKSQVSVDS
jgi:cell division protein FtsQ